MRKIASTSQGPTPGLVMNTRDWLLLGLLSLLWGSGFFFSKIAVRDIPPVTIVMVRVMFAAIILYGIVRAQRLPLPERSWTAWRPFFVMGLLNTTLPFTLNTWGVTRIDSSLAGILTATVPIFTVAVAHFATDDEHVSTPKVLGIGFGMAGVVAILGQDPSALTSGSGLAKLAILLSCILYGVSGVYARSLRDRPPLILGWGQMCASTVLLAPIVFLVDRPWSTATWSMDAMLSMIFLTVLGTAIAYVIYFKLLASSGATNASLVAYLIPLVAVLLGTIFLGERLLAQHVVGMVLIIAGMAVIDGRLWRLLARGRDLRPADT